VRIFGGFTARAVAVAVLVASCSAVLSRPAAADPAPTTTMLTTGTTSPVVGQPVTLTATVVPVPPAEGTPGAVLGFYDGAQILAVVVPTNGTATFTTTGLAVGSHSLTATSAGGPNFGPSTSVPLLITVGRIPTVTTVGATPASAVVGQPVTITASANAVAPGSAPAGAPIGFYDESTLLGVVVPTNGQAVLTTRSLLVGTHDITAVSTGGPMLAPSTSAPVEITTTSCGCDWPQFRGSASHSGVDSVESVLTSADVGGLVPLWTVPIGVQLESSPAIAGGVVYFGASDHGLYAVNAATGAPLWHDVLGDVVHSSPAVVGGVVYVGCNDGTVRAFDALTGAALWSVQTGGPVISSPAVTGGTVYIGTVGTLGTPGAGALFALDATTGAVDWSRAIGGSVYSSPAVAYGMVFVAGTDGRVDAFDAVTGASRWSFGTAGPIASSPAVTNGIVYIGSSDGRIWAFVATSGLPLFKVQTGSNVAASPAVNGPTVYEVSEAGTLYALNSISGAVRWTASTAGPNHSSPVVANGIVYIGGNGATEAFDAGSGALLWAGTSGSLVTASPAVAGGIVYSAGWDGVLRAYSLPPGRSS
jgi:outer membrane protein assembly factor BamB